MTETNEPHPYGTPNQPQVPAPEHPAQPADPQPAQSPDPNQPPAQPVPPGEGQ